MLQSIEALEAFYQLDSEGIQIRVGSNNKSDLQGTHENHIEDAVGRPSTGGCSLGSGKKLKTS